MEHPVHLMTASDLYEQTNDHEEGCRWLALIGGPLHDAMTHTSPGVDDDEMSDRLAWIEGCIFKAAIKYHGSDLIEVQTRECCVTDHHLQFTEDNDYRPISAEDALQGARYARYRADGSGISTAALEVLEARKRKGE